ncbi:hypothetical protein [Xylanibacter rodentium]|nr:hypothetical protein [Xylanibacter rodentium]
MNVSDKIIEAVERYGYCTKLSIFMILWQGRVAGHSEKHVPANV